MRAPRTRDTLRPSTAPPFPRQTLLPSPPARRFTVIFAVARCVGWLAQWNESFNDTSQRISRPRQLYIGAAQREFVPREERGE